MIRNIIAFDPGRTTGVLISCFDEEQEWLKIRKFFTIESGMILSTLKAFDEPNQIFIVEESPQWRVIEQTIIETYCKFFLENKNSAKVFIVSPSEWKQSRKYLIRALREINDRNLRFPRHVTDCFWMTIFVIFKQYSKLPKLEFEDDRK